MAEGFARLLQKEVFSAGDVGANITTAFGFNIAKDGSSPDPRIAQVPTVGGYGLMCEIPAIAGTHRCEWRWTGPAFFTNAYAPDAFFRTQNDTGNPPFFMLGYELFFPNTVANGYLLNENGPATFSQSHAVQPTGGGPLVVYQHFGSQHAIRQHTSYFPPDYPTGNEVATNLNGVALPFGQLFQLIIVVRYGATTAVANTRYYYRLASGAWPAAGNPTINTNSPNIPQIAGADNRMYQKGGFYIPRKKASNPDGSSTGRATVYFRKMYCYGATLGAGESVNAGAQSCFTFMRDTVFGTGSPPTPDPVPYHWIRSSDSVPLAGLTLAEDTAVKVVRSDTGATTGMTQVAMLLNNVSLGAPDTVAPFDTTLDVSVIGNSADNVLRGDVTDTAQNGTALANFDVSVPPLPVGPGEWDINLLTADFSGGSGALITQDNFTSGIFNSETIIVNGVRYDEGAFSNTATSWTHAFGVDLPEVGVLRLNFTHHFIGGFDNLNISVFARLDNVGDHDEVRPMQPSTATMVRFRGNTGFQIASPYVDEDTGQWIYPGSGDVAISGGFSTAGTYHIHVTFVPNVSAGQVTVTITVDEDPTFELVRTIEWPKDAHNRPYTGIWVAWLGQSNASRLEEFSLYSRADYSDMMPPQGLLNLVVTRDGGNIDVQVDEPTDL